LLPQQPNKPIDPLFIMPGQATFTKRRKLAWLVVNVILFGVVHMVNVAQAQQDSAGGQLLLQGMLI
jgi:hypothetical protein